MGEKQIEQYTKWVEDNPMIIHGIGLVSLGCDAMNDDGPVVHIGGLNLLREGAAIDVDANGVRTVTDQYGNVYTVPGADEMVKGRG